MTFRPGISALSAATLAAFLSLLTVPAASAQDQPATDAAPAGEAAAAAASDGAPAALTQGLAGPYLAGRMAVAENDFSAAARYLGRAVTIDPDSPFLQDNALLALISAGQMDDADALVRKMQDAGDETQLAGLLARAELARAEDWDALLARLDAAPAQSDAAPQGAGLLDGMLRGWALMGAGRASEALETFEGLSAIRGAEGMVNYHLALARALAGDFEGAETLLAEGAAQAHIMGLIARAQVLAQLDRRDEAIAMLDGTDGFEAEPGLQALRAQLAGDLPVAFDVVRSPVDGIAQVFLTFATILSSGPEPEPMSLIHARLAARLAPDMPEARLLVAQILQASGQLDLAEAEFAALSDLGAVRPIAQLSRVDALARAKRFDDAEAAVTTLAEANPDLAQIWIAMGDLYRQQEKWDQAIPAYNKALDLLQEAPPETRWFPLYARGIAHERAGNFDAAEADFLAAIEIRPDQPGLLNYLGYSWIDRNENLERGLDLIQKAVDLAPEDGYIQDSLAWAYFRMGRYADAVAPMEKAVLSMASDPVINDHLGDIYWMVGRKREAEVQWRRALSLEPGTVTEDLDPDRIRDKLERGLDAVLADEKSGKDRPRRAPASQTEAETTPDAAPASEDEAEDAPSQ